MLVESRNTDYVEEPSFVENQDSEEEENSMTNEVSVDNLISDLVRVSNTRNEFTTSSSSGSATKCKLSNDSSHALTKQILDEKH